MFQGRSGFAGLLKDGAKVFSGVDEAVLKNIDACKQLGSLLRTSLGPNSMNKLIVNFYGKRFVTSDAATIVEQLEVQHPAAKMLVLASKMQEQEFGDATNFVVVFGSELLALAESLLKEGLHTADVIRGYQLALDKAVTELHECVCWKVSNPRDVNELTKAIASTISSKKLGAEASIGRLVAEAAVQVMPSDPRNFDIDNIRVAKLTGRSLNESHVVNGMVLTREVSGTVREKKNCKVLVLACGLEASSTETKGTVLIKSADQLMNFTKLEEQQMDEAIKAIADAGVEVIMSGGAISDIAQHYCNNYNILTFRTTSKFELKRICKTLGAVALVRLGVPTAEEVGHAELVASMEISSKQTTVIRARDSRVATILLRGATPNLLDELERTIDDAAHCVAALTKDPRFVPGAGATEAELAKKLEAFGTSHSGLEQYGITKFAEALQCIPKVLAENAGLNATETVTHLLAAHALPNGKTVGIDVDMTLSSGGSGVIDVVRDVSPPVLDHHDTKEWAIRFAADAAMTILRVDQIIMARPSGGPKLDLKRPHWDAQDDN